MLPNFQLYEEFVQEIEEDIQLFPYDDNILTLISSFETFNYNGYSSIPIYQSNLHIDIYGYCPYLSNLPTGILIEYNSLPVSILALLKNHTSIYNHDKSVLLDFLDSNLNSLCSFYVTKNNYGYIYNNDSDILVYDNIPYDFKNFRKYCVALHSDKLEIYINNDLIFDMDIQIQPSYFLFGCDVKFENPASFYYSKLLIVKTVTEIFKYFDMLDWV